MSDDRAATTGIPGLDTILGGLLLGDNVVWRVDDVDDYRFYAGRFVEAALAAGKRVVAIRFASHGPILPPHIDIPVYNLDAYRGFESFTARLHGIIAAEGEGVFYVFDCLSELLDAWATDAMIGNFFAVTCPFLFRLDTIAYFALLRGSHSFATIARIRMTTQLLLDLHTCEGVRYLHPLKVWERSSPTLFLPHRQEGDRFIPITTSREATKLHARLGQLPSPERHLDSWHRLFIHAQRLSAKEGREQEKQEMVEQLCRHLLGRDERVLDLARRHFSLEDLLEIKSRLIGTGFIGGKATGMLLARQILRNDAGHDWESFLEPPDSFYVGSDLFCSYLVHNGWWELLMRQKTDEGYFAAGEELREKILTGEFPAEVREDFRKMLEYFGQYPIIVRSSSLLEDGFGNAFAGKYDSFFCVNQGSPDDRYRVLEESVRKIFASTLSEEALSYRLKRGLSRHDEQMALLVQRVSGAYHGSYFFPDMAGVGVSYNTFVWNRELDPRAGMLRMVVGLGTRAVDRTEGDYARLVALDRPDLLPHAGEDRSRFTQREADLLNVATNAVESIPLSRLVAEGVALPLSLAAERDRALAARRADRGLKREDGWIFTLTGLLSGTCFPKTMQRLLATLEESYRYPVDVEFTLNVGAGEELSLTIVQCRPLQTRGVGGRRVEIPEELPEERVLIRTRGNFMGGNVVRPLKRVIAVDAAAYSRLDLSEKYEIARMVGRLNRMSGGRDLCPTLLLGPGRWGTGTPSLGVPVRFAEIGNVAVLAEVAYPIGGLVPDLSFGSHFFQDMVEADIFFIALFPDREEAFLNEALLRAHPNRLAELLPEEERFAGVVRVLDFPEGSLELLADVVSQTAVCRLKG